MLRKLAPLVALVLNGCMLLPSQERQPSVHNPFPQIARVAVAPFFNLSTDPTLDGRQVATAYFNELQLVQGFEVVPVGVVEATIHEHHIALASPADARRVAQILQVDAIVIGAVTDFSPYYPPRCGLQVEWYAANPGFHPIPPGYGLPWGTHEEQDIPGPLVFEAEFALAREQLKTQTPSYEPIAAPLAQGAGKDATPKWEASKTTVTTHATGTPGSADATAKAPASTTASANGTTAPGAATSWPDPRGFVPPPPSRQPPVCWPSEAPILRHTRIYNGHDTDFTTALESYYNFRDDARFDGWQGYLQRSDDFIRFCCHMHIWEMLTARGGAGETRVVWRWPTIR